jgi:hypothetical protein
MRARLLFLSIVAAFMVASVSAVSAQTVQFFAVLAGPNETPSADADGQGVASVMFAGSGQVCFSILARLIATPTFAHIHEGGASVASGPIVVTLTTPAATAVAGTFASSGCISGQSTAVLARLRATPTNFYINVHNGAFPGGAIRGQLF